MRRLVLALLVTTFLALPGCHVRPAAVRGRYVATPIGPHAMRLQDRASGRWVKRECDLRVPTRRRLPETLIHPETGNQLSVQSFYAQSVQGPAYHPEHFAVAGTWRIWRLGEMPDERDLGQQIRWGVQVSWTREDGEPPHVEPMEIFDLPAIGSMAPDVWTPWRTASDVRGGSFAWWSEGHEGASDGAAPAPPTNPFELRCRVVLLEQPADDTVY